MNKWFWLGFLCAFLIGGAVVAVTRLDDGVDRAVETLRSPEAPDGGEASPHPLSRDAIAARDYQGSKLKVEDDLGDRGGYRSKVVSYQSDEFRVRALLNEPAGPWPANGWPVVIFNHGYIPPDEYRTTGGDYQYWLEGLTRAGYLVVKPDYRGHDQSEGNVRGCNFTPECAYDILHLIASLKRYPPADAERIGMVGHSMGGNITMRVITASDEVDASVILAGVVGTAEDLQYRWRRPGRTPPPRGMFGSSRRQMVEEYGSPRENREFWAAVTPLTYAAKIKGPVQVHHGDRDDEVPIVFSNSLVAKLREAKRPVEYFRYPGTGHQFDGQGGVVLQRMLALFDAQVRR